MLAASMTILFSRSLAGSDMPELWPASWAVHGACMVIWSCMMVLHGVVGKPVWFVVLLVLCLFHTMEYISIGSFGIVRTSFGSLVLALRTTHNLHMIIGRNSTIRSTKNNTLSLAHLAFESTLFFSFFCSPAVSFLWGVGIYFDFTYFMY